MTIRADQILTGELPQSVGPDNLEGTSQAMARADHVHSSARDDEEADCLAGDVVGDFVYVTGPKVLGRMQVTKADILDYDKMPALGMIVEKPSSTTAKVRWLGEVSGVYSGLTPRRVYFVGADGRATLELPSASGSYVQRVGVATGSGTLLLSLDVHLIKRA